MEINLTHDSQWTKHGDTFVSGHAFVEGEHLATQELAEHIAAVESKNELASVLSELNGFFAVVHQMDTEVHVAVDHVRSWPLYYAVTDDIYISDSAEWVHTTATQGNYDPNAVNEYLFTCYVTGADTVSTDVKQLQSGEILTFQTDGHTSSPRRSQYYTYEPNGSTGTVATFDDRLVESFQRLLQYADGRTILLGLSGGYDSRLIALMLHRLGYDNVVTYTTLTASGSSDEFTVAESVAADLGFRHIKIRTDHSDYEHLDNSDQLTMAEDIGYLSEYPHINKYILREKLRDEGLDPSEMVHVLGHHLVAGTFLPAEMRDRSTIDRDEFLDLMWDLHYSNWVEQGDLQLRDLFAGRILDRIPTGLYQDRSVESVTDVLKGYEQWYWQERLPKYVMACREYEYLGFNMWYPFLDRELCAFYEQCDYRDKIGKRFIKQYVDELDAQIRGTTQSSDSADATHPVRNLAWDTVVNITHSLPTPIMQYARQMYYTHLRDGVEYSDDPRYNVVSEEEFTSIQFDIINHRTLLLLALYRMGYFAAPTETEFDIALENETSFSSDEPATHGTQVRGTVEPSDNKIAND